MMWLKTLHQKLNINQQETNKKKYSIAFLNFGAKN